jgi:DNA-binding LacI/PurR family transcriptional regulator
VTSAPTINDVARAAGVSVATVSRVLNNKGDVAPATRRAVHEVITSLRFAPRSSRRRGAADRGRSRTLSLMFPTSVQGLTSFDLDFVMGAATATDDRDYSFNVVTRTLAPQQLRQLVEPGNVDGVILMQTLVQDWRVELLTSLGFPFVTIGAPPEPSSTSYVDFDLEGAVRHLVDLLVLLGHRDIGFISRPQAHVDAGVGSAVRLLAAHERVMHAHGLPCHVTAVELDEEAAGRAARELLRNEPAITALLTTHGSAAAGVLTALRQDGVRVPQDVSVVSISTSFIARLLTPELTHVHFPSAELGYRAAAILVRQLEELAAGGSPEPDSFRFSATLSMGASTSAVSRVAS